MTDGTTKIPDGAHATVLITFSGPFLYRLRLCAGILLFLAGSLLPWHAGGNLIITTEPEARFNP